MKMCTAWVALAFSVMAGAAGAQVIYKSTMPDGKVIYSEKPTPGATKVDKVEPPPPKSGITVVTPEEKARAEQFAKERSKASTAPAAAAKQDPVEEARKQLKDAEAALEAGKEPIPGERLGTVGGKSRLTDDYFGRQKRLEQAVADARKRLEELERGRR